TEEGVVHVQRNAFQVSQFLLGFADRLCLPDMQREATKRRRKARELDRTCPTRAHIKVSRSVDS
ncbi:hypothetical protein RB213_010255, partial [Colletotrichum asianum]